MLISATMPRQLAEFARAGSLQRHVLVRLDTEDMLSKTIKVGHYLTFPADKLPCLLFLLKDVIYTTASEQDLANIETRPLPWDVLDQRGMTKGHVGLARPKDLYPQDSGEEEGGAIPSLAPRSAAAAAASKGAQVAEERSKPTRKRCLVFCATRHTVDLLVPVLNHAGLLASGVHGSMDQQQRTSALEGLKSRDIEVLVVTDVAARGLDVPLLDCVINYDFPPTPKLFVHRAGRVGRAGTAGTCHSLVAAQELPFLMDTSVFLGRTLATEPHGSHGAAEAEVGYEEPGREAGESVNQDRGDSMGGSGQGGAQGPESGRAGASRASGVEVTKMADGNARGAGTDEPDNFLIGTAPYKYLVYWNRFLTEVFLRDSSLPSQAQTAARGHKLYAKTCAAASSEGVSRAKLAMSRGQLPRRVHWWFREMARLSGQVLESNQDVKRRQELAANTPPDKKSLPFEWQRDLWDMAEPFRHHLDAKRKAAAARDELDSVKKSVGTVRVSSATSVADDTAASVAVGPRQDGGTAAASTFAKDVQWELREAHEWRGGKSKRSKSARQKLLDSQSFVCPDIDYQTAGSHEDAFKDRALAVDNGGEMRDGAGPNVDDLVIDVPGDDAADLKRRTSQRKVWDKKKKRYVNAEDVSGAQGRELRVRNEAGRRMALQRPADGQEGNLYAKWKREHNLKIQAPGHTENLKNQRRAAGKALVTLRNSHAGPTLSGAEGSTPRHAASILAGPKRATPALVKLASSGQVLPAAAGGGGSNRNKERRMRAERQRQRSVVARTMCIAVWLRVGTLARLCGSVCMRVSHEGSHARVLVCASFTVPEWLRGVKDCRKCGHAIRHRVAYSRVWLRRVHR